MWTSVQMVQFSQELRSFVLAGDITLSVRLWTRPKVKVGGRYRVGAGEILVDAVDLVPFSAIDPADVSRSGEPDLETLRQRAAHAGPIHDDTLVYRIQFHPLGDGAPMPGLNWPARLPDLTDGTVTPRDWVDDDAAAVHAACQDPDVRRWLDVPVPFHMSDAVDFIAEQHQQWSTRRGASFAITRSVDGEVLGQCTLLTIDAERQSAQVTYAVDAGARGHGLAARAMGLMSDWAFQELGLRRLEFFIAPGNSASRAVAERLGCLLEERRKPASPDGRGPREQLLYVLTPSGADR